MPCDRRYLLLSAGTISLIQLSCIIEELIFKQLPHFHHFWFVALVELLLFTVCGQIAGSYQRGEPFAQLPQRPPGPLHLYVLVGLSLSAGTGLGKVAFKFLNYATGTVLKSMKLLPVMALSVCWLRRKFHALQYAAALLMVASAACFGLGERDVEPDFHPLGILLSFACLTAQAMQNTAADRLLRDHGAPIHEVMAWSNAFGFLATLVITILNRELFTGFAYFCRDPHYWGLLLLRCLLFYMGALLYTILMQDGGAAGAVFVTTMRKALTVALSFLIFPKPFTDKYLSGGVLLLLAVLSEYHGKSRNHEDTTPAGAGGTLGKGGGESAGGGEAAVLLRDNGSEASLSPAESEQQQQQHAASGGEAQASHGGGTLRPRHGTPPSGPS